MNKYERNIRVWSKYLMFGQLPMKINFVELGIKQRSIELSFKLYQMHIESMLNDSKVSLLQWPNDKQLSFPVIAIYWNRI